jgi:hypothetical protein
MKAVRWYAVGITRWLMMAVVWYYDGRNMGADDDNVVLYWRNLEVDDVNDVI